MSASFSDPGQESAAQVARRRAAEAYGLGDFQTAINLAEAALKANRRDADLISLMASAMSSLGRHDDAIRHMKRSLQIKPGDLNTMCSLASTYNSNGQVGLASKTADEVLAIEPLFGPALWLKARILEEHGRTEEALAFIEPIIADGYADASLVIAFAGLARQHRDRAPEAIDRLRELLGDTRLPTAKRHEVYFSLGHLLDAIGDYDEAFDAFDKGNKILRTSPALDVDQLRSFWSPEYLDAMPMARDRSELPVLVIGMPRSGTTLTERIIASHPNAASVGEGRVLTRLGPKTSGEPVTQQAVDDWGAQYLAFLGEQASKPTRRVVDKMPENYLALGLASRIVPGLRVIHALRDPRDVCLSCFFQDFGARLAYSTDLAVCATQYLRHLEAIEYWREVLDVEIAESRYEDLVTDPEPSARKLLDAAGLRFDPACLKFHESKKRVATASMSQVRKPIYQSSKQRWRRYEKHIGPMLEVLEPVLADEQDRG